MASPNDKCLAVNWLNPDENQERAIYVFTFDGSQRKTLLTMEADQGYANNLLWTPNSQWLLISASWQDGAPYTSALVNPDTCQIIPLTLPEVQANGWLP